MVGGAEGVPEADVFGAAAVGLVAAVVGELFVF